MRSLPKPLYKFFWQIQQDWLLNRESVPRSRLKVRWLLPNQLAIGRLPREGDESALAEARIQSVLSLCAVAEGDLPEAIQQQFQCFRFILPDSSFVCQLQAHHLAHVVNLIHERIQTGEAVYVHCQAGVERSPTACIAYLCRHHQLELWEAVNFVKQAHPRAMPTETQIQVIQAFLDVG